MRLIDADMIVYTTYADGDLTTSSMKASKADIDRMQMVDAIPVEWLRKQYPMNAKYCGDAYMNKAKIIRGVIREYEDYAFNRQVHQTIEEIDGDRR